MLISRTAHHVAVIGGASTYTPELVQGIASRGASLGVDELVLMGVSAIRRLRLVRSEFEVGFVGSAWKTDDSIFHDRVRAGLLAAAPGAILRLLGVPPVVGAALLGSDRLGLGAAVAAGSAPSSQPSASRSLDPACESRLTSETSRPNPAHFLSDRCLDGLTRQSVGSEHRHSWTSTVIVLY
ncbi:MAG: hypothetical protein OXC58_07845 [Acidimicrobiaceae bacterium]|nr:hypothetical protein [Acidimicrobiaceae bacterium]